MKLVSPTDLDRAQIETILKRADEIANGAAVNAPKPVTLALYNSQFPLPIDPATVLVATNVPMQRLDSKENIQSVKDGAVLFSDTETGSAERYRDKTAASFLNAGDGLNENPVRALMDAHAIRSLKGDLSKIRVAILGNLKFSAEAHSLARLLGIFGARISFVTPAALSMPYDLTDEVRLTAYEVEETNDLATTLRKTDALYLANIDAVRVEKKIYDKLKDFYALNADSFSDAKEGLVILGEWDGGDELLAPTRETVQKSARAVLLSLVELA